MTNFSSAYGGGSLNKLRYTSSGTFNPATDGQGRTMFRIFYGAGGGSGSGTGARGGGSGQMLLTDWIEITSSVTIVVGAGASGAASGTPGGNTGGETTITIGSITLKALGGTGGGGSNGGSTYLPGQSAGFGALLAETGSSGGNTGGPGIINPTGLITDGASKPRFIGGTIVSPPSSGNGAGGSGFEGTGGAGDGVNPPSAPTGYCSGSAGGGSGFGSPTARPGIVIFYWE